MLRSTFIEDLSTLKYFSNTDCCIAQQTGTNKFYILSDRLAIEIEPQLIDSNGEFIDPASAESYKNTLAELYNPFLPHLYKKINFQFWFQNTQPNFDLYQSSGGSGEYYAVHKKYPWIGINVTKRFNLFLRRDYGIYNLIGFENNDALFNEAWQKMQQESHVSEALQKLIVKGFEEFHRAEAAKELESSKQNISQVIVSSIFYSAEFIKLKAYAEKLGSLDPIAVSKSLKFKSYLELLHSGMEFNSLVKWLENLDNFAITFQGFFTPRPGLFEAKTPEETKSYHLFDELRHTVANLLTSYNFWQRFAINRTAPQLDQTTSTGLKKS